MLSVKFYICDRQRSIEDGYCDGYGCLDCEPYCNHTNNERYAKYDQVHNTNEWEPIQMGTDLGPVMTLWEIDPDDQDESLN